MTAVAGVCVATPPRTSTAIWTSKYTWCGMHANVKRAVILLLVLSLFIGNATAMLENTKPISLSDSVGLVASLSNHNENDTFKQRINLAPNNRLKITVTDVPSDIWFIVLQIHTWQYNATLSYEKELLDKVSNGSLCGSNIGLYLKTHNATAPIQVFLKHDNVNDLDALLVIVTYGRNAPIPGGCNMEFDIEVSPYQKRHTEDENNEIVTVDTQPASVLDGSPISCEKSEVQYKLYRLYLLGQNFTPDTYFDAIASMLTTQDIARNGDEILANTLTNCAERSDGIGTGIGSIYALVAIYENYSSAYVPIFTYACNSLLYRESHQFINDIATKFMALLLILMCLTIIIDHKYGRTSLINQVFYVLYGTSGYALARITDYSDGVGIMMGLIYMACYTISSPRLRVGNLTDFTRCNRWTLIWLRNLLMTLLAVCISCIYTPEGHYMVIFLGNRWLFWLMFISIILLIIIILPTAMTYVELSFDHIISDVSDINLVTWVPLGCYLVLVAFDYYIESNNSTVIIRSETIPGYHLVCMYPYPYSHVNLIIFCIGPAILLLTKRCASFLMPTNRNNGRFSRKNKPKKNKPKVAEQVAEQVNP